MINPFRFSSRKFFSQRQKVHWETVETVDHLKTNAHDTNGGIRRPIRFQGNRGCVREWKGDGSKWNRRRSNSLELGGISDSLFQSRGKDWRVFSAIWSADDRKTFIKLLPKLKKQRTIDHVTRICLIRFAILPAPRNIFPIAFHLDT